MRSTVVSLLLLVTLVSSALSVPTTPTSGESEPMQNNIAQPEAFNSGCQALAALGAFYP